MHCVDFNFNLIEFIYFFHIIYIYFILLHKINLCQRMSESNKRSDHVEIAPLFYRYVQFLSVKTCAHFVVSSTNIMSEVDIVI